MREWPTPWIFQVPTKKVIALELAEGKRKQLRPSINKGARLAASEKTRYQGVAVQPG